MPVKPVLALLVAFFVLVGCSDTSPAQPAPRATPDTPRYTVAQASGAINADPDGRCPSTGATYEGNGIWKCGPWSFDERTGIVFRTR